MAKKKPIVSKYGQWKYPGQETIIPNVNGSITMQGVPYPVLGIDDLGNQQMMMPGMDYQFPGNSVYEIPMAKNGGTKKVKIHSLPKVQKGGLTWGDYLKKRGVTDKDILSLGQDQIDSTFNKAIVGDYNKFPEIFKQDTNGKIDIKNQIYNEYLNNLISDYNDIYPISNGGNRVIVPNIVSSKGWRDPGIFGLNDKEYYQISNARSLDNADSEKFIDMYFKNQDKYNTMNVEKEGKAYRDVPVKWIDAYPKYGLKGIDAYNPEFPGEFRRDSSNLFRHPVLYDDQILGKQNIPLLGADWMRNYYEKAGTGDYTIRSNRDEHNNPAIYPKPNYRIEGAEAVASGVPNWGSTANINGQKYILGQPTQDLNFDQSYSIPASAMPGASAENVFVDTPDSDWMDNYNNKMNLYNITQENLARLKEYDPDYILDTAPITEDDRRVVEYENQYINNPNVGFYQTDPSERIEEPCVGCGTLYGSTKTGDENTTYHTYDVQYPEKNIFSKKDLSKLNENYYLQPSGNPGVAVLFHRRELGNGKYSSEVIGPVHARDFLNDDQQREFFSPKGGVTTVDYDPESSNIKIYPDMHSAWKIIDDETHAATRAKQQQTLKENTERIEREKEMYNSPKPKKIIAPPGLAYGGEPDFDKPKINFSSKTKSSDKNYLYKQTLYQDGSSEKTNRRTLKGFIAGAPKPGEPGAPPKFNYGGDISIPDLRKVKIDSLPKAQKGKEWEQLGYENRIYTYKDDPDFFDSHARLSDNSSYNDWIRKTVYSGKWGYNPVTGESVRLNADQQANVSPETKTLAKDVRNWTKEEKVAHPNSTIKNLPRTEVEQLRKEDKGFDQYVTNLEKEAGKRTAAAQTNAMVNNPAFYAPGVIGGLAVAPELLGAELFGTGVTAGNILNPMFIAHGVKNTLDSDSDMRRSWSKAYDNPTGANLFDAALETGLNSLNFLGARSLPGDIKAFGRGYNNIATGNSMIPYAWKSPAVGLSQEASANMFKGLLNSGKLTPEEQAIVIEYQSNSRPFTGRSGPHYTNVAKRDALNNIINKYQLQFPQNSNVIATRRFNFDRGNLGADIENGRMNFGDRPTSFSAGVGSEGYNGAPDRIVIPSRYTKTMGDKFLVNPYEKASAETLDLLDATAKDFALNSPSLNENLIKERELIGTGLEFKQVGKVKNDIGGFDYIVHPTNVTSGTTATTKGTNNITLDKWPRLFGDNTPVKPVIVPQGSQAELDLANARAKAFSESIFNKLKLQRFRPGQTFDVSNQEAKFMDNPDLQKVYDAHYAGDPTNPPSLNDWFYGDGNLHMSGRFTTNNFGDMNDIVAINRVDKFGAPAKNIPLDVAHESTHSRSIRLKSTQEERDIATDAWEPMIESSQFQTGPADGLNQAAEEAFAVQNELRHLLNDFDGSRIYTNSDIPEIENALQTLASSGHPYLDNITASQIDIKKLIKSLNLIGLGAATPVLINATQEKKKGGSVKRVKINSLPNNWKTK